MRVSSRSSLQFMSHSIDNCRVSMPNAQFGQKSGTRNMGGVLILYDGTVSTGASTSDEGTTIGEGVPSIPKTISTTRLSLNLAQGREEEKERDPTLPVKS